MTHCLYIRESPSRAHRPPPSMRMSLASVARVSASVALIASLMFASVLVSRRLDSSSSCDVADRASIGGGGSDSDAAAALQTGLSGTSGSVFDGQNRCVRFPRTCARGSRAGGRTRRRRRARETAAAARRRCGTPPTTRRRASGGPSSPRSSRCARTGRRWRFAPPGGARRSRARPWGRGCGRDAGLPRVVSPAPRSLALSLVRLSSALLERPGRRACECVHHRSRSGCRRSRLSLGLSLGLSLSLSLRRPRRRPGGARAPWVWGGLREKTSTGLDLVARSPCGRCDSWSHA